MFYDEDGKQQATKPTGKYQKVANEIGRLVDAKNAAYGDSFNLSGAVLALLYPNGVAVSQYDDMLAVTRVIDKLFRIATAKDALGESPWRDIAGYGLLASVGDGALRDNEFADGGLDR